MKWYVGIDGGGTKTAFVLGDAQGKTLRTFTAEGCSYQSIGVERAATRIADGVRALLGDRSLDDCGGCCIGLPCFGENAEADAQIEALLTRALHPMPLRLVNDVVVGWAGSLACAEGIHLVAGTGSIALGCGADGRFVRCGGWTEFFGDEGSCYWISREGMSLFSKQADGRVAKGALYSLVREAYDLRDDFRFVDIVLTELASRREKTAAFQRLVLAAAQAGDVSAQQLYVRAAHELAQLAAGVRAQLSWSAEPVKVSYHGGAFHAGEYLLSPLQKELAALGCTLQPPLGQATEGALLLAIKEFHNKEETRCF